MACLGLALTLYFAVIGSYLYFNAVVTDSEGEEIKLSEAVQHFLTSPIWTDLKVSIQTLNFKRFKYIDFSLYRRV